MIYVEIYSKYEKFHNLFNISSKNQLLFILKYDSFNYFSKSVDIFHNWTFLF